jgi:predicted nucleic acid-binding protein
VIELVDTSVLILAARRPGIGAMLTDKLAADEVAVCEPILLEYLNGARNLDEYARFDRALRATRVLHAGQADWQRVLEVHRQLAASGPGHQRSVRMIDLVIAAVAETHDVPIVHYDEDYDRIAAITGQPTRWIVPRGTA